MFSYIIFVINLFLYVFLNEIDNICKNTECNLTEQNNYFEKCEQEFNYFQNLNNNNYYSFCNEKPDPGPCKKSLLKFYFDQNLNSCKSFIYGGCKGNLNNFDSLNDCHNVCIQNNTLSTNNFFSFFNFYNFKGTNKCHLCPKSGSGCHCYKRYYFHPKSGTCKMFYYRGCHGNANNFLTEDSCLKSCQNEALDVCSLPPIKGPCKSIFHNYFFNKKTGLCEPFIYGGCQGNVNNFDNLLSCQKMCNQSIDICKLPVKIGSCNNYTQRYYFDINLQICTKFNYSGCQGNANNFVSLESCQQTCQFGIPEVNICKLPKDAGPCKAYIKRYYFNYETKQCEEFVYGGCEGNQNNFEDKETCENECEDEMIPEGNICKLPEDVGPCKSYIIRYYFNYETKQCEEFVYGGCKGNQNNFEDKETCEDKCKDEMIPEGNICKLPKDAGPCTAYIKRYYFNYETKHCEEFVYGGCKGNQNNFEDKETCEDECEDEMITEDNICKLPKDVGPCKSYILRYFFNYETKQCERFIYGGCEGNENNFKTKEKCQEKCKDEMIPEVDVCKLPMDKGPCNGLFKRYFFNQTNKKCQQFMYGGCKGNANNFKTKEKCQDECEDDLIPEIDICKLPKDVGPCIAYLTRYYFNNKTQKCEEFIYGGCEGNENNFENIQTCKDTCEPIINPEINVCDLQKDVGPCKGSIKRYFYNQTIEKCEEFIYGGCKGNENNFDSIIKCQKKCEKIINPKINVCDLQKDVGPCKKSIKRYFYNQTSEQCQEFIYGGCRGNGNNFKNVQTCKDTCEPILNHEINICELPNEVGPCKKSFNRYFYNQTSEKCEKFIYGGCKGNVNNFKNIETCQDTCEPIINPGINVCELPKEVGPCKALIKRYFYNQTSEKCEEFIYGGCRGNENNFKNIEVCQLNCEIKTLPTINICKLSKMVGPCNGLFKRYFYNQTSNKCEEFFFGGCEGNANNFLTLQTCEEICIFKTLPEINMCKLAMDKGPCNGSFKRYFFNETSKKCEVFTFGGCEGNANNFNNIEECITLCQPKMKLNYDICKLPNDSGPCSNNILRYYYNKDDKKCMKFNYGGCGGNKNNFNNLKLCKNKCEIKKVSNKFDLCNLSMDKGPCNAIFPRYYYNKIDKKCENFTYGGCGGNANNFEDYDSCSLLCESDNGSEFCLLPMDIGPCNISTPRYYFNQKENRCEQFLFGSCGGNGNNFYNYETCNKLCISSKTRIKNDKCNLPMLKGPCKQRFEKYYFDQNIKKCRPFIYGGCNGNANNFINLKECQNNCE